MAEVIADQVAPAAEPRRPLAGPRADIQGLRAVAVLAVIANHLWEWPAGGFVGVDVFFVVSGFLISDLLVRERKTSGRINFADFYRRRARRILPASTLVIVVTVLAAGALAGAGRANQVLSDGVWAFFFAGNWNMALSGTDYFNNDLVSPLQHYWSLSVEEQFYFVWPWVILAAFLATRRRGRRNRDIALFAAMAVLATASFAYSVWHTGAQPTWAYFSTFDRAWELAVGAMLAMAKPLLARMPAVAAGLLGWVGLAGIGAALVVTNPDSGFPAPAAALPVLSTAAVIAAGVGHRQRNQVLLVNPVAQYIGNISYSLYLWHFPIIILLLTVWPNRGGAYSTTVLVGTLVLSALTYRLVEEPVRQSAWLEPRRGRRLAGLQGSSRRLQVEWLCVLLVVVAGLWVFAFRTANPVVAPVSSLPDLVAPAAEGDEEPVQLLEVQAGRVEASLSMSQFPVLSPDPLGLSSVTWAQRLEEQACVDVTEANVGDCVFGPPDARRTAVLFGDSFAMAWLPGVQKAVTGRDWKLQQLTFQQCPPWDLPVEKFGGEPYPECAAWRDWAIQEINAIKPDLVILGVSHETVRRIQGESQDRDTVAAGLGDVLSELQARRTVVLSPPTDYRELEVVRDQVLFARRLRDFGHSGMGSCRPGPSHGC